MPGLAPSARFSPLAMRRIPGATEGDIARVTTDFARGAAFAAEVGFDAVEVHLGHNYLLSSFLSPNLNTRTDGYGGSVANRARFPARSSPPCARAVGPGIAVLAKLNMADGLPGGLWLDESRLDTMERALAEGFSFLAMARVLLREPDLIN